MKHTELCKIGAEWLCKNGLDKWDKPKYVAIELTALIPCEPDIFGFGSTWTQQIEVKVSRSDFLVDKKKYHRMNPSNDVGMLRSYLCPTGLIKPEELPKSWGLLYIDENKEISRIVNPNVQISAGAFELRIINSILRRIKIKPQIFDFKKHKINEQTPFSSVCL